jgi:hypothetical protein
MRRRSYNAINEQRTHTRCNVNQIQRETESKLNVEECLGSMNVIQKHVNVIYENDIISLIYASVR